MHHTAAAAFIVLVYLSFSSYPGIAQPQSARALVASPIFLRPHLQLMAQYLQLPQ